MRLIDHIIVHCTATHADWWSGTPTSAKVAEVRKWHLGRGWSDIGYHYLIDRDGTVATGRPIEKVGAHTKGHNTGSIGIALFGGHGSSENDLFKDNFTPQQEAALLRLIRDLRAKYPAINRVSGHNEFAAKACPGFRVQPWYKGQKPRTSPAQSTTLQAAGLSSAGVLGAAGTAVGALDSTAQVIVIAGAVVALLGLAWIARERIRRWAAGDR